MLSEYQLQIIDNFFLDKNKNLFLIYAIKKQNLLSKLKTIFKLRLIDHEICQKFWV